MKQAMGLSEFSSLSGYTRLYPNVVCATSKGSAQTRPDCAYTQSDQSRCLSLEYSMSVKLLTGSFGVSKLKKRLHRLA